ncbi:hypothetical protein Tco_0343014 [Tanacetum coccineum]
MSPNLILKNKIKCDIKDWTFARSAAQNLAKEELSRNLIELDLKAKRGLISLFDIDKRDEWLMGLSSLEHLYREDLKQKSWIKWVIKGDENSKFLHSLLQNKYACSMIRGIHINGVWCDSPDQIKLAALNHFVLDSGRIMYLGLGSSVLYFESCKILMLCFLNRLSY